MSFKSLRREDEDGALGDIEDLLPALEMAVGP
jgi:hypothetical protein